MKRPRTAAALAALCLALIAVGVLAYGLADPQATLLGPAVVRWPDAGRREVALTFDDGPSVPYTAEVLDVLRERHVKATFFLCGANALRYPGLVRRIQAEGHVIGNHTYSHPYLYLERESRIADEIDRTQDVLERISGRRPTLFRPPFGVRWFTLWPLLRARRMTMVLWSVRGYDGALDARGIERATLEKLQPGAIILLHDGFETHAPEQVDRSATVRALPAIIEGARKAGYTFAQIRD